MVSRVTSLINPCRQLVSSIAGRNWLCRTPIFNYRIKNVEYLSTMPGSEITIGTHNGCFHCDEALACYMLKLLPRYKNASIIRTRDDKILDNCDIVVDVGGVYDPLKHRYDHHMRDFKESVSTVLKKPGFDCDIKLSSAGLVYCHFGEEIIEQLVPEITDEQDRTSIFKRIYDSLIKEVDAIDNGVPMFDGEPVYRIVTNLSSRVSRLNPEWNGPKSDPDMQFHKAVALVGEEFNYFVQSAAKVWWPARSIVRDSILARFEVHPSGEIIKLSQSLPWKEHLFELEEELGIAGDIKYVIFNDNSYRVQGVPLNSGSFVCRRELAEFPKDSEERNYAIDISVERDELCLLLKSEIPKDSDERLCATTETSMERESSEFSSTELSRVLEDSNFITEVSLDRNESDTFLRTEIPRDLENLECAKDIFMETDESNILLNPELPRSFANTNCTTHTKIERDATSDSAVDSNASGSVDQKTKGVRKRTRYSFREKLMVLNAVDTGAEHAICNKLGVKYSTLKKWIRNRAEIEKAYKKENNQDCKGNRAVANQDVDNALYIWFLQARVNGLPVSGSILRSKALTFNKELGGLETFKASEGWLSRWKRRKGVQLATEKFTLHEEDEDKLKQSLWNILSDKQLTRTQVFNFNETGLTYKSLPRKRVEGNDEIQASGNAKQQNERVTICACSNADGSLKLPLIIVGRWASPRALKNLSKEKLPVSYRSEKTASMDDDIFENWFRNEFVPQVQVFLEEKNLPMRALLITDKSRARNLPRVGDIETTSLPPTVTSIIQPFNQGILETLKSRYRYKLVSSILNAQENSIGLDDYLKKFTIREVIFWMHDAWWEITPEAIANCWNKIWLPDTETDPLASDDSTEDESEETVARGKNKTTDELLRILRKIHGYENITETNVCNWLATVECWATEQRLSDSEIEDQV